MWKKNAPPVDSAPSIPPSSPGAGKTSSRTSPSRAATSGAKALGSTTIGSSISIRGDITGDGDLLIEGQVQGSIELRQHTVTVGSGARVEADVHSKRICVDGEVKGDLYGEEVVIRETGRVVGNANATRVTLENGCTFRGAIDMQSGGKKASSMPQHHASSASGG